MSHYSQLLFGASGRPSSRSAVNGITSAGEEGSAVPYSVEAWVSKSAWKTFFSHARLQEIGPAVPLPAE